LGNSAAWDTLTWFAALIAMAAYLNKFGFIPWFSNRCVAQSLEWGGELGAQRCGRAHSAVHNCKLLLSGCASLFGPARMSLELFQVVVCVAFRQYLK